MREKVVTALIRGDEAKAFAVVEPLDGTGIHNESLKLKIKPSRTETGRDEGSIKEE
jgi:hypothetical protein